MSEIITVLIFGFLAGFIDSIAGGGGLISVPALMSIGLPPQIALGTNKIQSTIASTVSSIGYIKSGKVNKRLLVRLIPVVAIGTVMGVVVIKLLPNEWLQPIVIGLLVIMMVYSLFKKNWGEKDRYKELNNKMVIVVSFLALLIGFYDGFFGPGTGSFLIFVFLLTGMNFLGAAANAKILNTISNLIALITFMIFGMLHYKYGLIMAFGAIPGAYLGTKVAVTKGVKLVKPIFIIITISLLTKLIVNFYF